MTRLPAPLHEAISDLTGRIESVEGVGGGDINQAAKLTTAQGQIFLKYHHSPPPDFFTCEAAGLRLLSDTGTIRIPEVIGLGEVAGSKTAYLLLEWIESGRKTPQSAESLGRGLAMLHQKPQPHYGLDHDNFIGSLPQSNNPSESWISFYATHRLAAQRDLAAQKGRLPTHRAQMLDKLIGSLDKWIDESACRPSLLHGDLWGGNWMTDSENNPVIIDPAVYIGDREADLAMTALFGGFPQTFYDAYQEVTPLEAGHEDREPLYKLYYLLCHLNLFGESYGGSVDGVLGRFVG